MKKASDGGGRRVKVVVVGSIGLDDVETRFAARTELLGGSVSYACAASALFSPTGMVGIVGTDFPQPYRDLYGRLGVDTAGLEFREGKTFRWSGVYDEDMINRTTRRTELNVFETFRPELPSPYRGARHILLGNISPELQAHVLDGARSPRFVVADTMDLWIRIAREPLLGVIRRVDMLMLNDGEARLLTGVYNLRDCARALLQMGPSYVVIKKGEHGAMLFSKEGIFLVPAFPVEVVHDPTGAGDSFAGAFLGRLACARTITEARVREALLYGSVVASFTVEAFSLDRLAQVSLADVESRMSVLRRMTKVA
jgi:sugar/nucleoside kinase (ribokinase family)